MKLTSQAANCLVSWRPSLRKWGHGSTGEDAKLQGRGQIGAIRAWAYAAVDLLIEKSPKQPSVRAKMQVSWTGGMMTESTPEKMVWRVVSDGFRRTTILKPKSPGSLPRRTAP